MTRRSISFRRKILCQAAEEQNKINFNQRSTILPKDYLSSNLEDECIYFYHKLNELYKKDDGNKGVFYVE